MRRSLLIQAVTVMVNAFRQLEKQVPAPVPVPFRDGVVYRYREQAIEQALVLKLARTITGLKAVDVLLLEGLLQEQGAICRMLDEIGEDIMFLVAAVTNDRVTELHHRYLQAFWSELFSDPAHHAGSLKKPDTPPRRKVRSYISRVLNEGKPPPQAEEDLSRVYSGYVHAAGAAVMDLYDPNLGLFRIEEMRASPLMADHIYDIWNYVYRAIGSHVAVAKAFGDAPLAETLYEYLDRFVDESGARADPDLKRPRAPMRAREQSS